jgi:hypothetical protein
MAVLHVSGLWFVRASPAYRNVDGANDIANAWMDKATSQPANVPDFGT